MTGGREAVQGMPLAYKRRRIRPLLASARQVDKGRSGSGRALCSSDALRRPLTAHCHSPCSPQHFYWTKNLWRSNKLEFPEYCSPDTPQHQCKGVCNGLSEAIEAGTGGAYIDTFGDTSVIEAIKDLTTDEQITVIDSMCSSGLAIGDQLEAASPVDPSFWPIHPNLERVWMIKKLSGTFTNETWPSSGSSLLSSTGEECYGHGADDVLPYGDIYGVPADQNLTNADLYEIMSPLDGTLPYIYDSFDLAHCEYVRGGWGCV